MKTYSIGFVDRNEVQSYNINKIFEVSTTIYNVGLAYLVKQDKLARKDSNFKYKPSIRDTTSIESILKEEPYVNIIKASNISKPSIQFILADLVDNYKNGRSLRFKKGMNISLGEYNAKRDDKYKWNNKQKSLKHISKNNKYFSRDDRRRYSTNFYSYCMPKFIDSYNVIILKQNGLNTKTPALQILGFEDNSIIIKTPKFKKLKVKTNRYMLNKIKKANIQPANLKQIKLINKGTQVEVQLVLDNYDFKKPINKKKNTRKVVGLDTNLKHGEIFISNEGEVFKISGEDRMKLQEYEYKISLLNKKLARANKNSNNRVSIVNKLKGYYFKQNNLKDNIGRGLAREIIEFYNDATIILEDLTVISMRKYKGSSLNSDLKMMPIAKYNNFVQEYAADFKCRVEVIDPYNTSKTCYHCKEVNKELTSEKKWECPSCKKRINRDTNAALNIRERGICKLKENKVN